MSQEVLAQKTRISVMHLFEPHSSAMSQQTENPPKSFFFPIFFSIWRPEAKLDRSIGKPTGNCSQRGDISYPNSDTNTIKLFAMTQCSKYPHNSQQLIALGSRRPLKIHLPNKLPHPFHTILQLPVHDQRTHTHRRKNRIPCLAHVFQPHLLWHLLHL